MKNRIRKAFLIVLALALALLSAASAFADLAPLPEEREVSQGALDLDGAVEAAGSPAWLPYAFAGILALLVIFCIFVLRSRIKKR